MSDDIARGEYFGMTETEFYARARQQRLVSVRRDDLRNVLAYIEARGDPKPLVEAAGHSHEFACQQFADIIERLRSAIGDFAARGE